MNYHISFCRQHPRFNSITNGGRSNNVRCSGGSLSISPILNSSGGISSGIDKSSLNSSFLRGISFSNNSNSLLRNHQSPEIDDHHNDYGDNNNDEYGEYDAPLEEEVVDDENHLLRIRYITFQHKIYDILYEHQNNRRSNNTSSTYRNNSTSYNSGLTNSLNIGWTKNISNTLNGKPEINDLLDIYIYTRSNFFSAKQGDGLLFLLRKLFLRHPTIDDIFLYKEIRSINTSVGKALHDIYSIIEFKFEYPEMLLGVNEQERTKIRNKLRHAVDKSTNTIYMAKGIGLNVIELISDSVLSMKPTDLDQVPVVEFHNGHDKIYNRFASGRAFKIIYDEVQYRYGENVTPICIQFSFDATEMNGGGGSQAKTATPFYIRILNVANEIFSLDANTILAGFAPELTVSILILIIIQILHIKYVLVYIFNKYNMLLTIYLTCFLWYLLYIYLY
jgi:hypothetical protein